MPATDPPLTRAQAESLAQTLMRRHGVTARGWRFEWSRAKRRLGEARIRQTRDRKTGRTRTVKAIRLSRYLVEHNGEAAVRDVILHEIAHALAGLEHGHDAVWRAMCEKVGAKPERLADESIRVVQGEYAVVCTLCHRELARRHRRSNPSKLANAYCRTCGPKSTGKLKIINAQDAAPTP